MLAKVIYASFVLLPAVVLSAERGSPCKTPNHESATCTPLNSCKVILDATATSNTDALEFAEESKCDKANESLVCCGSEGNYYQASPLLPNSTMCGPDQRQDPLIGVSTDFEEFPWLALLRYNFPNGTDAGFNCGGTLINNRYLLTAAHCVTINNHQELVLDSARLGEAVISTVVDCDEYAEYCAEPPVDLKIEMEIVHPEYDSTTKQNDIALLRLERNVKYTSYIRPICLPHPNSAVPVEETDLKVAGWGITDNGLETDLKFKGTVHAVSKSDCSAKIQQNIEITDKNVCAEGHMKKVFCLVDSGGPLMRLYRTRTTYTVRFYQEGILSSRVSCGVPAVYTMVAIYMDWIVNNLSD